MDSQRGLICRGLNRKKVVVIDMYVASPDRTDGFLTTLPKEKDRLTPAGTQSMVPQYQVHYHFLPAITACREE